MGEFLKFLSPKIQARLAMIFGVAVIMLFLSTLVGFFYIRDEAGEDDHLDEAARLARAADTDFQLAVSKGKNFAILKDEANKERVLSYFKQAQDDFDRLSQMEQDPQGRQLLYRLGVALRSSEFSLKILTATAKKSDAPEKLYSRYLKDITIDFDNASRDYLVFLDGEIEDEESRLNRNILVDLVLALTGILLGLGGMGLSASITRSLRQALANEKTSQERFRILSEVAEEAILIHDQGMIVDVNPALTRMLGYTVSELIGRHVSQFMDTASAETTRQRIQDGYPENSYEIKARRKDGSTFPLLVHGRDIEYEGRKLRLSCGWDMTEWKKAEEELRESQERFERFAEVTKEGILIHENGIIIDVNDTLLQMTGLTRVELIGSDGNLALSEESAAKINEFRRIGYPTGPYEITLQCKDGRFLPVEVHGQPFSYGGRTIRVASFWDLTERKKAEEALYESEERFRRFAEVTKEGILIHEKGIIQDVNQALVEMVGLPASEIIGKDTTVFLTNESADFVKNVRKEGYPEAPYEITFRRSDGTLVPGEALGRNFAFQGKKLRVVSVWDITERKKAEKALRRSEERFRAILENSYEAITLSTEDGKAIYVSPSNRKLSGFETEERLGRNMFEMAHPDDLPRIGEAFQELRGSPGKTMTLQARIRHKSGGWRVAEFTATNLLQNPDVGGILVNGRDITEKVKAEEALEQKERYFQTMLEKSYEAFVLVGPDKTVRYTSPAMESVYGWTVEDRVGKNAFELIHPDDKAKAQEFVVELLRKPGRTEAIQMRFRHKNGNYLVIDARATNLIDDPDVGGVVINYRNVTEKVKVEEALRQSEEKFRSLIENSHDVISITGSNRSMTYISPSVKRVLGYEPPERLGQGYAEIMHPDDVERIKGEFAKLVGAEGATWTVQFRLRHKDGSWRYVESTGTNLLENPAVQGIVYNLRDVTEKKEAEDTLRQSEENFRNLIEKSPDALLVHRDGKIVYANPKLPILLGYEEAGELLGKSATFPLHPDDQKLVAQRIQTLSQGGKTSPIEIRLVRRDGAVLPVEVASIAIQFEGKPAIMVTLRDITARKQAEAAVLESQERYRSLVESMPDAVMIHDEENILYVNPSAVKTFGAKREEEFVGKPFWMLVAPEFHDSVRARVRAIVERGAINELAERKLKRLDGTSIDVLVTSVPFNDRGRRVVLAIFLDITALKEAERKAQRYQRLAALGEMAAGMAHEIRNPTAAISAQAQYLLKKMEKTDTTYEQLKDILAQCERLETLVHDTLDYSPEKKFEERTEIPAKDLLQKALWLAQTQFGPSHARVQVILDSPENMPLLRVHPTRMDRVLVNLILNAFQAMPEGGHLLLGAKKAGNKVVLRVQDDGKGVTEEEMARLFEPFYTSRKMGSGLGLAICQKIVEEHQGKIRVEQVEPHGAAFTIELPLE